MSTATRMSVAEYLALPVDEPWEYIDGEAQRKPVVDWRHGWLVRRLNRLLDEYIEQHGGGGGPEVRVRLDDPEAFAGVQYRLPDTSYWAPDRPIFAGEATLPPTLAIEVRSPGQSLDEQRERCRYLRARGVDLCWLIDPDSRTVEVFGPTGQGVHREGDRFEATELPGLVLDVAWLFAALDAP